MRRQAETIRAQAVTLGGSLRAMTTVTQFNPVHDFGSRKGISPADDVNQFKHMIVNPGPLRITYSPDYLDWYYKAYNNRVRFEKEKEVKAQKFNGSTITGSQAYAAGLSSKSIRPKSSLRRVAGEEKKAEAQATITEASIQHGLFDAFERQPQFPNIHIDRCTDEHILAIFNEMILPTAVTAEEVWEKALMYRALLIEREKSYPASFEYIIRTAKDVALTEPKAKEGDNEGFVSFPEDDSNSILPSKGSADYFTYLVKRYHVDNANEAAIVLQCHGSADAEKLLFSNPPPSEKAEAFKAPKPTSYPSLLALSDTNNIGLLKCLIFGEFNCMVSTDPFVKYPEAASHVLRPRSEATLEVHANPNTAIATAVTGRRGSLLSPLTPNTDSSIDARGRDVLRAQQNHANADAFFNKELAKRMEVDPSLYAADRGQYNPRAIRAEVRDYNSRQLLKALKAYDDAETSLVHRQSNDLYKAARNNGVAPGLMGNISVIPTIAHYANLLLSDKHISFCVAALPIEKANSIRQCVVDTAEVLYEIAREYHIEQQRLMHGQKLKVVASLLDFEVNAAIKDLSQDEICSTGARQLGSYVGVATRKLDELGQTTTARADDYNRWMRPVGKATL